MFRVEQAIMWGALIGILVIVGIVASCYFKDRYCCDGEPEEGGFCCFGRKKKYKKTVNFRE